MEIYQATSFQPLRKSPKLKLPMCFAYVQDVHLYPTEELKIKLSV